MKKYNKKQLQNGFTLIELIVVIALIAVLTTVVLFNSTRLNSAILVSNTAYEVGLIVRESQVAGLGVKAVNTGGKASFTSSHGVHFNMSQPTKIILFADVNGNGVYDSYGGELTQEYDIQNKRSGTVLSICAKRTESNGVCTTSNSSFTSALSADVVFTRPNPEAFFKIQKSGSVPEPHEGAIVINIGFANDVCRSITLEKTGSVRIDTEYCAPIN